MSLVRLEKISKSFGSKPILADIDFRVEEGEKVGLIGRNGTGKSTVFRLIMNEMEAEKGVIERMRRARIACLSQMPQIAPDDTIFDAVMHAFSDLIETEHELGRLEEALGNGDNSVFDRYSVLQDEFSARGGYDFRQRAKRVLHGLGFTVHDFELKISALSGGQRTRLMLALVLLEEADLLLLDEPENHLDIEAREWLESYLTSSPHAFVIISHDRAMLNAVVQRVVEVERCGLQSYTGNYDRYLEAKALIREQWQRAYEKQQEFIQREESWINRFRYKATKAAQAQERQKKLDKMERVDAPPPEASQVKFRWGGAVRTGQIVLEAKDLSMAYGSLALYKNVSISVERGERIGVIGPNGCGKTTFLRHLAGRLPDGAGEVKSGHKASIGFYDQHHESVNRANDILREVHSVKPAWTPEQVRSFMGRFLFTGEDIFKPISALSGGELGRVAIAKLILSEANVLLLDEPTNHLDIASREALEAALEDFPGTMIMVSHDRALIDRLATRLIVFDRGTTIVHWGNYSHYRWKHAEEEAQKAQTQAAKTAEDVLRIRRDEKSSPKTAKPSTQKSRSKQRKEFEELERHIEEMEELLTELEAKFTTVDPADFVRLQEMKDEYDAMKADLEGMYAEWERLAEEMAQ